MDWNVVAGIKPDPLTRAEYERHIREKARLADDLHRRLRDTEARASNLKGWVAFLACALGYVVLRYFGFG